MSEQKLQVFAFTVHYLWYPHQAIDFKEWDRDFLGQYKEYMDLAKDANHDLTKLETPVLGTDVINGPMLFRFFEDTLRTAHTPCGVFYTYAT